MYLYLYSSSLLVGWDFLGSGTFGYVSIMVYQHLSKPAMPLGFTSQFTTPEKNKKKQPWNLKIEPIGSLEEDIPIWNSSFSGLE